MTPLTRRADRLARTQPQPAPTEARRLVVLPSLPPLPLSLGPSTSALRRRVLRVLVVQLLTGLLFLGLGVRLWTLQVARVAHYERLAAANRVRLEPTEAPRGGIFDRRGRVLAGNRLAPRVVIMRLAPETPRAQVTLAANLGPRAAAALAPTPPPSLTEQVAQVADLLALSVAERARVAADLADTTKPTFSPVVLAETVDPIHLTQIEERLWRLPNVVIEDVPQRVYPEGAATAHVIGYVGSISPAQLADRRTRQDREIALLQARLDRLRRGLAAPAGDEVAALEERLAVLRRLRDLMTGTVGKTGVEATYEVLAGGAAGLQGEPGLRTWQVNARNQPVKLLRTTDGQAGHALHLHLDLAVQQAAHRALGGRRGAAVALDPRDGAVLALVSSPSYDPNVFVPRISRETYARLADDRARPFQNRAISSVYSPGSTFKGMVTAAAGLKAGVITEGMAINCTGGWHVGRRWTRCWAVHGGGIDLFDAIAQSCNVFFYRAALAMGPQPILDTARSFGLGAPTGIDLPSEASGHMPTVAEHEQRHQQRWFASDTANLAIGQGDVQVSALQTAQVCAAVANGGTLWRPQVLREVRTRDSRAVVQPWQPQPAGTVDVAPALLAKVRAGMRQAVTGGTCRSALGLDTVAVAGKTGSAEAGRSRLPHAWIVAFAPYEHPTIALCVVVENSGHGSTNAGPVARAMLEAYFAATPAERP